METRILRGVSTHFYLGLIISSRKSLSFDLKKFDADNLFHDEALSLSLSSCNLVNLLNKNVKLLTTITRGCS